MLKTNTAIISLLDEDVLRIEYKEDAYVQLHDFEENLQAYRKVMKTEKAFLLTIANAGAEPSPEVRAVFSSRMRSEFKIAEAFVISSIAQRILANFVMRVQPPHHPVKFFNNEADAKRWLYEQRKKVRAGKSLKRENKQALLLQ